ncbi:hypothetical protein DSP71_06580, partial [Microbacterium sp. H6]
APPPADTADTATGGSVLTAEQTSPGADAPGTVVDPEPVVPPEAVSAPEPATPALTKPPFIPRDRTVPDPSGELTASETAAPQW